MKSLIVLVSYHHNNTRKIAEEMARKFDAQIRSPQQVDPEELQDYDLVGFGSGIYDEKHHLSLLDLVDMLPQVTNRKAFIFSTSSNLEPFDKFHHPLKEKLQSKGYIIIDEFSCPGLNTNSFLKHLGGLNKGRPNVEDLRHAEEFAQHLKQNIELT